jgi:hypothetical protein
MARSIAQVALVVRDYIVVVFFDLYSNKWDLMRVDNNGIKHRD